MMNRKTVLAAALVCTAAPSSAVTLSYTDFSSTAGLDLNGNAAAATDGSGRSVLRVTPALPSQAGSVFSVSPVTLGEDVSFSTRFTFNFNEQGNGGADGIVFVVQTNTSDVGGAGGGIGYLGIPNSVGVEFDNWDNAAIDGFNANHVGIDIAGDVNSVVRNDTPGVNFDTDGDVTAWVDYNGAIGLIEVRLSGGSARPTDPLLSYNTDLAAVLGSVNAFVGFTSGTGAAWANHDIISWEFRDAFAPIGGGGGGEVPEPAALGLFGLGMLVVVASRRRKVA